MRRRSSSLSDSSLYPKTSRHFRVAQMILSIVCLGLALYYWTTGNTLLGATVILFATSFGFVVITLIDVLASLKRRQYEAPVWVGQAFLAAFMFFLSFGLMILQKIPIHIVIGVIFGITGIVFLIDGIIIIVNLLQITLSKKIHPTPPEKESLDEPLQVEDELEIIEELPVEVKRYAPVEKAPVNKRKSSAKSFQRQFPVTTYGGTFPVGENNAAPLPTPNELTGLEPVSSPQSLSPRRRKISRDNSSNTHSSSTIDHFVIKRDSNGGNEKLYPVVEEDVVAETVKEVNSNKPEGQPDDSQRDRVNSDSSPPQEGQANEYYAGKDVIVQVHSVPPQPESLKEKNDENIQAETISASKASGEPQAVISTRNPQLDSGYQKQIESIDAQICRCCGARPQPPPHQTEPREEITPYVVHHYNQTPCPCGYTHYEASTVVKGAVKQHPQDTLKQQQRIIIEQLEQMRDDHVFRSCCCHDKPTKEEIVKNVENFSQTDGDPSDISGPSLYGNARNEDNNYPEDLDCPKELNELNEPPSSKFISSSSRRLVLKSEPSREDKVACRRVTIGALDIMQSSDATRESDSSKYERWARRMSLESAPQTEGTSDPVCQSLSKDSDEGSSNNWEGSFSQDDEVDQRGRKKRPTVELINNEYRKMGSPSIDGSKETMLGADIDEISYRRTFGNVEVATDQDDAFNSRRSSGESTDYLAKRKSRLGTKDVRDSRELLTIQSSSNEHAKTIDREKQARTSGTRIAEEIFDSDKKGSFDASQLSSSPQDSDSMRVCRGIPRECFCCPNIEKKTGTPGTKSKKNIVEHGRRKPLPNYSKNEKDRKMENRRVNTGIRDGPKRPDLIEPKYFGEDYGTQRGEQNSFQKNEQKAPSGVLDSDQKMGKQTFQDQGEDGNEKTPFSPLHYGFPRDVMMIHQITCSCKCVRHSNKSRQCTMASNFFKYLNEQPYHPRDNFQIPNNTFANLTRIERRPERNSMNGNSPKRNSSSDRASQTETFTERKSGFLEENEVLLSKKEMNDRECINECPSCPIRRARLEREARLGDLFHVEDEMSTSRRSSLKRSYPEERNC